MLDNDDTGDLRNMTHPGFEDSSLDDTSQDDFGNDLATAQDDAPTTLDEADDEKAQQDDDQGPDDNDAERDEQPPEPDEPEPEGEEGVNETAQDGTDRDHRIPKSRFDEVNERRKAAERRLQEMEKEREASDPSKAVDFDFDAKEKEYMDAVLDGESDKALSIRKEIRAAEQAAVDARLQEAQGSAKEQTKAELELQSTIGELQTQYPQFNGESDNFDQELTNEALDLFESFKMRGYDPAAAMRRAVRYTVSANGVEAPSTARQAKAEPESKPSRPRSTQPTPEQRSRKLDVAQQQPPATTGQNVDDTPDVMNMPEEQFDKLSAEDERVARGDFL